MFLNRYFDYNFNEEMTITRMGRNDNSQSILLHVIIKSWDPIFYTKNLEEVVCLISIGNFSPRFIRPLNWARADFPTCLECDELFVQSSQLVRRWTIWTVITTRKTSKEEKILKVITPNFVIFNKFNYF